MINRYRFGFNTLTIGGPLEQKLNVIRGAGFSAIELWDDDLVRHAGGFRAAQDLVRRSRLRVCDYKLLRDFEGSVPQVRQAKIEEAKRVIEQMHEVGASLLLVCSNTSPNSSPDVDVMTEDLAELGRLAESTAIKIGYEGLAWGRWINTVEQAWDVVARTDCTSVGLVVDSFHIFARHSDPACLEAIPTDRIFLVQLADYVPDDRNIVSVARHHRVFPGEGPHDIAGLIAMLEANGYGGDYTFEVYNDDYFRTDPFAVAERAMRSRRWLQDKVAAQKKWPS